MAQCASQEILSLKRSPGLEPSWGRFSSAGTAVFPTTAATANVITGYLAPQSVVMVGNHAALNYKLVEVLTGRKYGPHGEIVVGTINGANSSGTCNFYWHVLNP